MLSRPSGAGGLRLEMSLDGARAESAAYGVKITVGGSGRELAYSRLRVADAAGHEISATLEVVGPERLAVRVNDEAAVYPLRIDPTFSDADWVRVNAAGILGVNGAVFAIATTGSGEIILGGEFSLGGDMAASNIVKWDGGTWSALGTGTDSIVTSLAIVGTDLFAGGYFTSAGGMAAKYIAKWNGGAWTPVGSGMDFIVYALATDDTDLYAGGSFTMAGGVPSNRIARWNGSTWSPLGSGLDGGGVSALALNGGDLYAEGDFTTAGGVAASKVAKWNGSHWTALGSGIGGFSKSVNALVFSGGNLYAGGNFDSAGGNERRWNCKVERQRVVGLWLGNERRSLHGGRSLRVGGERPRHLCSRRFCDGRRSSSEEHCEMERQRMVRRRLGNRRPCEGAGH